MHIEECQASELRQQRITAQSPRFSGWMQKGNEFGSNPSLGPSLSCAFGIKRKLTVEYLKLYDAAILTRCYTQHALWPYIDSKINHIRHFIKIQFVNKGIEFINLPSIFKDKSVISSIPTYFENKESPIICYKYNKPIRSTVFNYNKLVTELDIENSIPDS